MIVTIHDLIKHISKGSDTTTRHPLLYWPKYFGYLIIVWLAVHRASHIIVPAKYWKDILIKKYHLNPAKISVTYEGVSKTFMERSTKDYPFVASGSLVVYTGNLYPHKNIPILIRAIELAKVNLVIVCARSVFEKRLPISPRVQYLGRLTDEQLVSLYQGAVAFTFPSLIEGFGLPGLEAMAAGLPVIAARASCLPEVYGDAALFFDPHDPVDLADKIQTLLIDKKLREMLIAKGQLQVKKYSWATMANQTWEIYQSVLNSHAPVYGS